MWTRAQLAGVSVVGSKEINPHDILIPGSTDKEAK